MNEEFYLVWSNEHGSWWRANGAGYTRLIEGAGRFRRRQAENICRDANMFLPPDAPRHEVLVLAPESLPTEPPHA